MRQPETAGGMRSSGSHLLHVSDMLKRCMRRRSSRDTDVTSEIPKQENGVSGGSVIILAMLNYGLTTYDAQTVQLDNLAE